LLLGFLSSLVLFGSLVSDLLAQIRLHNHRRDGIARARIRRAIREVRRGLIPSHGKPERAS
jgi:hypothetical protein